MRHNFAVSALWQPPAVFMVTSFVAAVDCETHRRIRGGYIPQKADDAVRELTPMNMACRGIE